MTSQEDINALEVAAIQPTYPNPDKLNLSCSLPYGLGPLHVLSTMTEFCAFLGHINRALHANELPRLESFLMPAGFSSLVGEFAAANLPKHCLSIVKNNYHNGHPDLVPAGCYEKDAVQHGTEGIEIKASRYVQGWQGHNAEEVWLMVFVFDSNRPVDARDAIEPKPFRYRKVYCGYLTPDDWLFSGRSETSRRTITASVKRSGFEKMKANWIYDDDYLPSLLPAAG